VTGLTGATGSEGCGEAEDGPAGCDQRPPGWAINKTATRANAGRI
jgi:hypothetical protein